MKTIFLSIAAVAMLALAGERLSSQELIATPDTVGGKATDAPAPESTKSPDAWRYKWFNDRWWYWTPENRWMWYSDDGQWVPYDPNDGYVYPAPGYYYAPGVAVGVAPYGNVGVGVGRRVGVNVWGPHGAVRVGRIHVGW